MRYAARRDAGEQNLVQIARRLGASLWRLHTPCDWLMLYRGAWYAVECKTAEGTLTRAQREFHAEVSERGGRVLLWASKSDVYRDLGARVSA